MTLHLVQTQPLNLGEGGIDLLEVGTRAGNDDLQFDGGLRVQRVGFGRSRELDGALGMTQCPLAVGHDREMTWSAAHPAGGSQFTDGFGPLARAVGNQSDGLPDDADATAPGPGRPGVTPREFGFLVGQCAGGHQVRRDPIGAFLAQAAEIATHLRIEFVSGGPVRKVGPPFADVLLTTAGPAFGFPPDRRIPAIRCSSVPRRTRPAVVHGRSMVIAT